MCRARKIIASSETLRCSASTTNRGQWGVLKRADVHDAEHDGGAEQQQRDGARGARQVPVQARAGGQDRGHRRGTSAATAGQSPIVYTRPA